MIQVKVDLEIPEAIRGRTSREIVHNGKVYIAEVKPKLKDNTPSWLLIALLTDGFAGLGYIMAFLRPTAEWPAEANYVFGTVIMIAVVLIVLIIRSGGPVQVTDP